jgi:molecular chaperone HtpG
VIHYSVEGNLSYTALMFIPSETPYNFYYADYEPGLQLYSKGVFILDKAKDLLPDHYRFVTGLIDSDDLNLNISREILQQDRQVKALAKSIEKKIHGALADMLKDDREGYEKFFDNFGLSLKYGIYRDYGIHKQDLQDLIIFRTSKEGKYATLKEYTDRMPADQKAIYYACGSSPEEIEKLPSLGKLREKGYEILYFLDERDELVSDIMRTYEDKPFKSVNKGDLDLETEDEKKAKQELEEKNKDLLETMKDSLGGKVREVRISSRLKDDPVCLVSDENGVSLEMEKLLSRDPNHSGFKASKILEINPNHAIFAKLQELKEKDPEALKEYTDVLFQQALLIQGLEIEDPVAYAKKIVDLMLK